MTGWRPDDAASYQSRTTPLVPPVHHAVTYLLDETAYKDIADGGLRETWYSRFSNPTVEAAAEVIRVGTGHGVLSILELQPEGKRVMTAREFLAGHVVQPGLRFA